MIDARPYFDSYILRYSSPRELADVLTYTHLCGERCLGRVLRLQMLLLLALAIAACTPHLIVRPDSGPPVPRSAPLAAPTRSLMPTITPDVRS